MQSRKGVKSWIFYWERQPGTPLPIAENNEVVSVVPPSWGDDRVCNLLERLYFERAATPAELVQWRNGTHAPYRPKPVYYMHTTKVSGLAFYCGHNPILYARKVQNLTIQDENKITWEEMSVEHKEQFCRTTYGVHNCPEAAQGPIVICKSWTGRGN